MGYRVLVTDYYRERPAYALADHHEVVDITDREATLTVARRYRIDGIICDTTDIGVPTAAYVAEQLGLPGMGYEVALNFTHKGRMRQMTERSGLKVPQYRLLKAGDSLDALTQELAMPVIVKPVDSQSGKGVTIVADRDALLRACHHAREHSREGSVLIERVVQGTEVIVDGFMLDGEVNVLAMARKTPNPLQPTVSKRITYGECLPKETAEQVEAVNRRTLTALGLMSGVFHAEYMLSGEDVIPIDIAARGGGCMIYTHVLPDVSGVDANRAMIELTMGERPTILPTRSKAANIEFFGMPEGALAAIEGGDEAARLPGVLGMHFNLAVGDHIGPLSNKNDRPGYIVAGGETADAAIEAALTAKSYLRVRMQGDDRPLPVT
jgi:biotin carboxylase